MWQRSDAWDLAWVLGCAAASSLYCLAAAAQLSATFDEPLYVTRGLERWRTGSYAGLMHIGTMPLPVDVQTLPLHLWERWRGTPFDATADLEQLLPWARGATLLFWWALLAYGFLAGRAIAGHWGGRLAVVLLAAEPNLLAHASLATTDVAVAACTLAFAYHFQAGRAGAWTRRVGIPTVWFAACVLAKASGLAVGIVTMAAIEIARRLAVALPSFGASSPFEKGGLRGICSNKSVSRFPHALLFQGGGLHAFAGDAAQIVLGGLVLVFLYCGSDWRAEPSFVAWARSLPDAPQAQPALWLAEHLRVFPNAGEALARQIKHNVRGAGGHWAYVLGEVRRAFWYYFAVALAIKLPVSVLALPVFVAALRPRALCNWATAAAAALLLSSLTYRVQIGIRMVLPLIALAVVGLAAAVVRARELAPAGWRRRLAGTAAVAAAGGTLAAAATAWPNGLCYANVLWGGPARTHVFLSDSNCDWGQGLKELARWQREQGIAGLDVWYFGTDPLFGRLPMHALPLHLFPVGESADVAAVLRGRRVAASTTLLYGTPINRAHEIAAAFLRAHPPAARTATFFIYDFSGSLTPTSLDKFKTGLSRQACGP